jgi:hypothetical protein
MIMAMGRIIVMSMSFIRCLILLVYVDLKNSPQYGDDLEEPSNLKRELDECKFQTFDFERLIQ